MLSPGSPHDELGSPHTPVKPFTGKGRTKPLSAYRPQALAFAAQHKAAAGAAAEDTFSDDADVGAGAETATLDDASSISMTTRTGRSPGLSLDDILAELPSASPHISPLQPLEGPVYEIPAGVFETVALRNLYIDFQTVFQNRIAYAELCTTLRAQGLTEISNTINDWLQGRTAFPSREVFERAHSVAGPGFQFRSFQEFVNDTTIYVREPDGALRITPKNEKPTLIGGAGIILDPSRAYNTVFKSPTGMRAWTQGDEPGMESLPGHEDINALPRTLGELFIGLAGVTAETPIAVDSELTFLATQYRQEVLNPPKSILAGHPSEMNNRGANAECKRTFKIIKKEDGTYQIDLRIRYFSATYRRGKETPQDVEPCLFDYTWSSVLEERNHPAKERYFVAKNFGLSGPDAALLTDFIRECSRPVAGSSDVEIETQEIERQFNYNQIVLNALELRTTCIKAWLESHPDSGFTAHQLVAVFDLYNFLADDSNFFPQRARRMNYAMIKNPTDFAKNMALLSNIYEQFGASMQEKPELGKLVLQILRQKPSADFESERKFLQQFITVHKDNLKVKLKELATFIEKNFPRQNAICFFEALQSIYAAGYMASKTSPSAARSFYNTFPHRVRGFSIFQRTENNAELAEIYYMLKGSALSLGVK